MTYSDISDLYGAISTSLVRAKIFYWMLVNILISTTIMSIMFIFVMEKVGMCNTVYQIFNLTPYLQFRMKNDRLMLSVYLGDK